MFEKFKKRIRMNGKHSAHADAVGAVTKTEQIARIVFQLEFPKAIKPFADRLTNLEGTVMELGGTVKGLEGTVKSLGGTVKGLEGTVESLESTVKGLEDTVSRNHAEVMAAIREIKEGAGPSGASQN